MKTIRGTIELGPATAKRQAYSPLEPYWDAFQEWRRRVKLHDELSRLTDVELADIGVTRGEIDHIAMRHHSSEWRQSRARILILLGSAFLFAFGSEAGAQCTARDVLQHQLRLKSRIPLPPVPPVRTPIRRRCPGVEEDYGRKFFGSARAS